MSKTWKTGMRFASALFAGALICAGCSSTQISGLGRRLDASLGPLRNFDFADIQPLPRPDPETAVQLGFIRDNSGDILRNAIITVNGVEVAALRIRRYCTVLVSPGTHEVNVRSTDYMRTNLTIDVTVEPQEAQFFAVYAVSPPRREGESRRMLRASLPYGLRPIRQEDFEQRKSRGSEFVVKYAD